MDCYGDPVVIGKIGRDIEEKKCGWLVCQALLRTSPEQKQIILVSHPIAYQSDTRPLTVAIGPLWQG